MDDGFVEVSGSSWKKFTKTGDTVTGMFTEWFTKEAKDDFGEQTVAIIETDTGTVNVGLPASNPRYDGAIRKFIPWHDVRITLTGFYNQTLDQVVSEPGKTKSGRSFARNFSIQQSSLINPKYNNNAQDMVSVFDDKKDLADMPF